VTAAADAVPHEELKSLLDRTQKALTLWVQVGLNDAQRADVFGHVVAILTPWAAYVESRNNLPGHEAPDEVLRPLIADLNDAIARMATRS
jgi:hypothetical protein